MIQVTDKTFNRLTWGTLDAMDLDSLITGMEIVGAEPTDYPATDGLTIYLRSKSGELYALDTGYDPYMTEQPDPPVYIHWAKIPEEESS